jgi:hypothetical protein
MKPFCPLLIVLFGLAIFGLTIFGQASPEDQDNYFTGTLVENASDHLKVSRNQRGKADARVFQVNAQTKVEGRLRLKQRVAVRYISGDDGDIAILVIVRPPAPKKQK